jgi:uncharacterized protein
MKSMTYDIRQQVRLLVELQGIEIEIRKHQRVLDQVDRRTQELDAQIQEYTAAVENGQARLHELTKTCRSLESELQINQGRIAKSHEKLRLIKTNKEYRSGLKEIEDLGVIGSKIEDDILACLDEIETAQASLKDHQTRLDAQAGSIRREKEAVLQEAEETRSRLQQREQEDLSLSGRVAPEVLALYRRVQAKKADGIGIASVYGAVCRGCNVNIPPQMYNELQRFDRLKNCPNCDRIIYWEEAESRPE